MIAHVNPIADVEAVTIDRHRFVAEKVGNKERKHLFRKLVWTVVIGATRDDRWEIEGVHVAAHEQICGRLARGIGAVWSKRRFFGKVTVGPEAAVDLIC